MSRKQWRRAERAAARMGLPLAQYEAWTKCELPEDHPNPGGEPLLSDLQLGLRMIRTVERSKMLQHLKPEMTGRRGPKGPVPPKTLLVCIQLASHLSTKSYRRSDVCAALAGLHPVVAEMLGLIDNNGNRIPVAYKALCKMIKKMEGKLWLGWDSGDVRCDLAWFHHQLITATIPRKIRRSTTAVVVDSTPVPAWARTLNYTKQSDLKKDAYAYHRKAVLDNPDLPEPELRRRELAAAAKRRGLRVGTDGRIIRGKDPDMRAGWATATAKTPGHYYVGYELTLVVAARSMSWRGNPSRAKLDPGIPNYILAMSLTPAGTNPGPIGFAAVSRALQIAPKINEVIADRGYTNKREDFVRPLHQLGINVVMDYTKTMVNQPQATTLGKRREPVVIHCGTILSNGIPHNKKTAPDRLRRAGKEQELQQWYAERARLFRWSSKGPTAGGGRRFQSPVRAGRVAAAHGPSPKSYNMPLVAVPTTPAGSDLRVVNARVEELDTYQEHPWGTPVWKKSYGRRNVVEGSNGKAKANKGLGGESCQAFGLAANTLAALFIVIAYNRKLTRTVKVVRRVLKRRRQRANAGATSCEQSNDSTAGASAPPTGTDSTLRAPP